MRYAYPVTLIAQADSDAVTASFDNLPGATWGATEAEAMDRAVDLFVTSMSSYVEDGKSTPAPTAAKGRKLIAVPVLEATKLALHDAMLRAKISNVELARRMGCDEKAVRRLRDPLYRSHISQVEAALRCLGKRIDVTVSDAAA